MALVVSPQLLAFQDVGELNPESVKKLYPGKTYSPYAQRSFPTNVYWGDTHLHTALSPDAGLFGNKLGLDEAYRLARGEEVTSSTGLPARLSRPLDWLVLTEHTDMMGFATDLLRGAPILIQKREPSITRVSSKFRHHAGLFTTKYISVLSFQKMPG